MTPARPLIATGVATVLALGLAACSGDSSSDSAQSSGAQASSAGAGAASSAAADATGTWPRTVTTQDGQGNEKQIKISEQPKKIFSTSVTLTGQLLALDAPVDSIGVQSKGNAIADDKGFFTQWADKANEKGVKVGYEQEPSVEAILNADPDLVVMSASGQDSAAKIYDQLADVVPIVVVDYSNKTWDETLNELAAATGHEKEADQAISAYDKRVKEVSESIKAPEQPVNIVSLGKGGSTINAWTEKSAQGRLLNDLGWDLAIPDEKLGGGNPAFKGRNDVISVSAENFGPALTGKTIAAINADGNSAPAEKIKQMPQLADNEAVKNDRVYDFPPEFFRIDYFSAMDTLAFIEQTFKK